MRTVRGIPMLWLAAAVAVAACDVDRPLGPAAADALLDAAPPPHSEAGGDKRITVMTRNLYLGSSLDPVLGVSSPAQIPAGVATVWNAVQATAFPERAEALADEIVASNPELVGIQEAALWRTQFPGDAHLGNPVPATAVAYDFLAILLAELAERGARYRVASLVQNADVEMISATGMDVRFTDRDVILARADVQTANPQHGTFAARLNFPVGGAGGPLVSIVRGWTTVDVLHRGRWLRFANTHLEVDPAPFGAIQVLQGSELRALLAASPHPVILAGDLNSAADGSTTPTYAQFLAAGWDDEWTEARPGEDGFTSSQEADLRNTTSVLHQRIDFVLTMGDFEALSADVLGDEPADRTPSGLWPSDHAGVVATLEFGALPLVAAGG